MAVTAKVYSKMFAAAFNEEHDLLDDTIKVALVTSTYTPDQDVHDYFNDITNEVVGTGYSAGGAAIANDTFTYTAGSNLYTYDGDDVSWASSTITARTAIVYNSTGGGADASRGLICYQQESGDIVSTNGTFTVAWNASGIFTITIG